MRSKWIGFAAAGLAALVSSAPAGAKQQEDVIAMSSMSQTVKDYAFKTGTEIVGSIETAQKAMATTTNDFKTALVAVDKAIALVNSVQAASPTESFRQKLGDLFHRHRTKQAKSTDVIPVSGVLNDIKQVNAAGVENVNTKLEDVKGKLEQVSTPESEAELIDASDDVGYLEIDLPVQQTKTLLMEAHAAIENQDAANANKALSDALTRTKMWTAKAHVGVVEGGAATQ
jgi:hypothetical protein